jgi:hypothetical protein
VKYPVLDKHLILGQDRTLYYTIWHGIEISIVSITYAFATFELNHNLILSLLQCYLINKCSISDHIYVLLCNSQQIAYVSPNILAKPIISGRISKLNNISLAKLVKSNGLIGPSKILL